MKLLLAAALVSVLVSVVVCDHWALLVAGSNSYMNYRHQADICHAYHVLHSHGIPDERIVVMMYDDIAHNRENPIQGNVINRPNGKNLYPGVLKDYTAHDVTPAVFLSVLSGDEKGVEKLTGKKGKVIKSGPNDNVFVYFADHGAPGLIAFPDDELHAEELNKVILKMHKNKQYKKMVLYVEACESGSMFHKILRKDINVYATTAANGDESSYAVYWDKERNTYLGDVYSVKWMQDSDVENLNKETLKHQFQVVKKETNTSHVMEYGDLSIAQELVGEFQGNTSNPHFASDEENVPITDAIPSELVPLETLRRRAESATGFHAEEAGEAYRQLIRKNQATRRFFENIVHFSSFRLDYQQVSKKSVRFTDFQCYRQGIQTIKRDCPGMKLSQNDFALRNLRVLANLCEMEIPEGKISLAIKMASGKCGVC